MTVLFGKVLMNERGEEMCDDTCPLCKRPTKGGPFTLKAACFGALGATFQDEQTLPGEEKFKRYELYKKIKDATDPVELKSEDVVLLKKLVGKAYGPLIMGQCWDLLENK
jgi:hypothetical protein